MKVFLLLIVMLVVSSCTTNSHTINHCGGIDIPICKKEVEGKRNLPDEIEFQETEMKKKMLRSINLLLDNLIQSILKESL